jgi:hypothetical protein
MSEYPMREYHKVPKVRSRDVVEVMKEALARPDLRAGTADSDVNVFAVEIAVPRCVIEQAIEEIEWLRVRVFRRP